MTNKMTKLTRMGFVALLLSTTAFLGACENTVHGAGRDIERAGDAVQNTVE